MPQLTVGVIGYRNHSAKLISLINQKKYVGKIISYCYKKNLLKHLNKKKNSKKFHLHLIWKILIPVTRLL